MKYDVLGRRIQKSVNIGSQTKIENYYHSGQQVIEVRDGNDQLLRQYIYGNGIDEIIRMDKYEGDTFTSYYYHTDANGSVTAITDADGKLIERITYDIYGMPTFWDAAGNKISKSSIGNNILFHGREYDTELNLYYFRARYYDPIMGRFLQTDPMGYADSMNLYQGFNMNPVNFIDPFGKQHWIIEEELAGQEALKEHLIKKYGKTKGEMEFEQIIGSQRRIETAMAASFFLATGGMLIAPHLSVPALVATVGSISTYSALESYSSRKQAGQTENEAKRGAFGAATGFNFLFNLMGYDYGTLEKVSQEEVENAWSTLIGGVAGGWLAKMITAPVVEAELAPKIHMGKQGKHIPGHNNYLQGRSKLTYNNPQNLVDRFAGKGQQVGNIPSGMPGFKERVDFGEVIGIYVDKTTGESIPTTVGIIHYSKDGVHIVPARPK
jgi:RHS repeat-associated protein